ncbi:hypothetical protein [Agrobacterium vaccinii]|uniref:hypothetical protein n=1 Tax=Agrobacterium vaccinii TaxID=2735528 RepID=UPI001E2A1791|nr:hypothetical protein [Agrobacterium vaccinii]UHS59191.1 hypothetical protein HRS00_20405 [Agrobacterium vaccinii]
MRTKFFIVMSMAAVALSGLEPMPASAETVLLSRGDDTFGQGWLFLDASGACRIATPKHVVERADGSLSSPDLLDSVGRLHPTSSPVTAKDEALDLAFLTVRGTIAKDGCSRDRVRKTPLEPIINSIKQATLEITTPTERQSLTVAVRALSRDAEGGKIIALSPSDASASFQKGMSGGTVMFNGRPIAMIFEVDPDEGIGIALRYDVIAAELENAQVSVSQTTDMDKRTHSYDSLVLMKGKVTQKDTSVGSFLAGTSSLHVGPVDGRVSIVVDLNGFLTTTRIRLTGKGSTNEGSLIVEADNDGQGFVPGTRCQLAAETTCVMSPRRASRLRLTLTGLKESGYEIEKLDLLPM